MTDTGHIEWLSNQQLKLQKEWQYWRWGEQLGNNLEGNKKMFWKEVKRLRKGEMVKDVNGEILRDGFEVRRKWADYVEQVLNVANARETIINVVDIGGQSCEN